jgi:hypothetical protein
MMTEFNHNLKLALYAVPFGYGPASVALAVVRSLNKIANVEWTVIGDGVSVELFSREGFLFNHVPYQFGSNNFELVDQTALTNDGIVVFMDFEFANHLADRLPVFLIDTIGFTCAQNEFISYKKLHKLKRFYVQDLFNSYSHLDKLGVKKLYAVPLVSQQSAQSGMNSSEKKKRAVIHLGGFYNPLFEEGERLYLNFLVNLITKAKLVNPMVLLGESSLKKFGDVLSDFDCRSVSHGELTQLYLDSSSIWSIPGLTTTVELGTLGLSYNVLPPLNYVHCLTIFEMVRFYQQELSAVWLYLNDLYSSITTGLLENEGLIKLNELNRAILQDTTFVETFLMKSNYGNEKILLPGVFRNKNNGADVIAQDICSCLKIDGIL